MKRRQGPQLGMVLPTVLALAMLSSVLVMAAWRNLGLAEAWGQMAQQRWTLQQVSHAALLAAVQQHAKDHGCCKLTLEVLTGNTRALKSYLGFGFEPYALDPAAGQASFMQKWL